MKTLCNKHESPSVGKLIILALSAGILATPLPGAAAPFIYTKSSNGTLSVVDLATNRVVDSIVYGDATAYHYGALAAHQKTGDLYVGSTSTGSSDQVSIVDATTASTTKTIAFTEFVDEAIAHKTLSKVYVMPLLDRVSAVSASSQKVLSKVPTTWPAADIDVGGARLFGLQQNGWDYGFFVADTGTDTLIKEVTFPSALGDDQVIKVAAHPQGSLLYVFDYTYFLGGKLDVRDGATLDLVTSVPTTFGEPLEVKASPDGKTMAVRTGNQMVFMSLVNYSVLGTMTFNTPLAGIPVFSDDSQTLYTLESGLLHVIDVKTRTIDRSIGVGAGAVNLALLNDIPADTGGVTTAMTISHFQCTNLTTGQVVSRDVVGRTAWNCDALGFNSSAGDSVQITVEGNRN